MSKLTSEQTLRLSEAGKGASHPEIGHLLLCAAFPQTPPDELRLLTLGQRNAVLLRLREINFGPALSCVAECAVCRALIQSSATLPEIMATGLATAALPEQEVESGGFRVRFRPVSCQDLSMIATCADTATAEATLIGRCILSATNNGGHVSSSDLPRGLVCRIGAILAENDPQSEMLFRYVCPECGAAGMTIFDPVSYLWREVCFHARHILDEVRCLERAYGWSESLILKMSTARRRLYMEAAV